MWDDSPGRLGYYEEANLDLTNPRNKGFTSTVDALTTHGIALELLQPNDSHHQRMVQLADIIVDRLATSMDLGDVRFGFPEVFNNDWTLNRAQTGGYVGHVLKSAWVLARVYLLHPDARYRDAARKLIREVVNNGGWDEANGVPYTSTNWSTGWINQSQSEYWQIEQAVTAGLSNWYISANEAERDAYLRMADRSLQFFAEHVLDHVKGGSYLMNSPTGSVVNSGKGDAFKAEYHSAETFYFAYLYGNLMYRREPVTLYYRIPPLSSTQVVKLSPVAIDDGSIKILDVRFNGNTHSDYDGTRREVTLRASEGGTIRVVFGPAN
jgi:hypothetical protein